MRKVIISIFGLFFLSCFFSGAVYAIEEESLIQGARCVYPVRVAGKSMEPRVSEGTRLIFNKCVTDKKDKLEPGTIILYKREGRTKISVVREKIEGSNGQVYYKTSREQNKEMTEDVFSDDILAIYQEKDNSTGLETGAASKEFKVNPFYILVGIITISIFFAAIFYWRKKTAVPLRIFGAGTLVWSFMLAIKALMDFKINALIAPWGYVGSFFYFGLRTGILESGLSYWYVKAKLKNANFNQAVAFGIGFNGVEAVMVGLIMLFISTALFINPNLLSFFPESLRQDVVTGYSSSSLAALAPIVERLSVVLIGVFTSVLVFLSIRTKKITYLLISIGFKTLIDGAYSIIGQIPFQVWGVSFTVWSCLIEIPIVFLALISYWGTKKVKQVYPPKIDE